MDWQRPLNDVDATVTRTVSAIATIAKRAAHYATLLLLAVAVIALVSFGLGVAALSGGIESVWIVLGLAFGSIAIGAAVIGRWRIGGIRRNVPGIADEVRSLLKDVKRETIEVIDQFDDEHEASDSASMVVVSRHVMGLRGLVGHGIAGTEKLTKSITAITSFPLLALTAVLIAVVFAVMVPIFLLALAL